MMGEWYGLVWDLSTDGYEGRNAKISGVGKDLSSIATVTLKGLSWEAGKENRGRCRLLSFRLFPPSSTFNIVIGAPSLPARYPLVQQLQSLLATMKFPTALLTLFLTLIVANASTPHDHSLAARHSRISRRMPTLEKKSPQRRCKNRRKPEVTTGRYYFLQYAC